MKFSWAILITVFFCGNGFAQNCRLFSEQRKGSEFQYQMPDVSTAGLRSVWIWQFPFGDFDAARVSIAEKMNNHYVPMVFGVAAKGKFIRRGPIERGVMDHGMYHGIDPSSGMWAEGILDTLQRFALDLMYRIHYLNPQARGEQVEISHRLDPSQITYVEIAETLKTEEVMNLNEDERPYLRRGRKLDLPWTFTRAEHEERPEEERVFFDDLFRRSGLNQPWPEVEHHYSLVKGSAWLVAGQKPGMSFFLPLESRPLVTPLNKRGRWVWEIGRAAETKGKSFAEALRHLGAVAYRQLLVLGGDLDQSDVYVHSLDEAHTRMFQRYYGMEIYSRYRHGGAEAVLVLPLRKLLERLDLEILGDEVHQTIEASNGVLTAQDAMKLKDQALSWVAHTKAGSNQIRDFTRVSGAFIIEALREHGVQEGDLDSTALRLLRIPSEQLQDHWTEYEIFGVRMSSILPREKPGTTGRMSLRHFLYHYRALDVSYVDLGRIEPQKHLSSLLTALFVGYNIYARKMQLLRVPEQMIAANHIHVGALIQSQAFTQEMANYLRPTDFWFPERDHYPEAALDFEKLFSQIPKSSYVELVLSVRRIHQLAQENAVLWREAAMLADVFEETELDSQIRRFDEIIETLN